jgi:2-(1,2-epoxy-1,2-dihydrophenyl)acetyl-CoA isomerase
VQISVTVGADRVGVIEFENPPNNFFNEELLRQLADAYERFDSDPNCRAILLCATGRHFCAGADFGGGKILGVQAIYAQAYRLFAAGLPVVAAVQGAAVGGGLGLAVSADFRIATEHTRFMANFSRLGLHHGFGLTVTLPAVVGAQRANDLLLTGRPVKGPEALQIGLCDRMVADDELRDAAHAYAADLAGAAPLAVRSIRATMREGLAERVKAATEHEAAEQAKLFATEDFKEGVAATSERRQPSFTGR